MKQIRILLLLVLALGLPGTAIDSWAQDLDKVQPQQPPRLVPEPAPLNVPVEALVHSGALPGEEIVIPNLVGVRFVSSPEQVETNGISLVGLDVSDVPMLQRPEFKAVSHLFLDRPASVASLNQVSLMIRSYLSSIGYPFVAVYLPPQDITSGAVQYVVIQSELDEILRIEGARWFGEDQYRRQVSQAPGEPIDLDQLKKDIDWLNRNPFRSVSMTAAPGRKRGTTDLALRVNERFPVRVYTGYNNTGSEVSAEDRLTAGFTWGNAFWLGHQLGYQYTTSPDFETSFAHSGNYSIDLPWRHALRFYGSYSELEGRVLFPLSLMGKSWQTGMAYEIPLPRIKQRTTHSVSLGFDFKYSDNNLVFATIPVTDNVTHVVQWSLSYNLSFPDQRGQTSFGASIIHSPGGLTDQNDDTFYNISRNGATANYTYATLDVNRSTRLPWKFRLDNRARFQWSADNLIGSEQLGAGGLNWIRGYEEGEVYGDRGVVFSTELVLPSVSPLGWMGLGRAADQFEAFGFYDAARLASVNKLPGERPNTEMHSVGAGFRYRVRNNLNAQLAYGRQLKASRASRSGDNSRVHVSVTLSY